MAPASTGPQVRAGDILARQVSLHSAWACALASLGQLSSAQPGVEAGGAGIRDSVRRRRASLTAEQVNVGCPTASRLFRGLMSY